MKQTQDQYQTAEKTFIRQLTQGRFEAYTLACLKHQPLLRELLKKHAPKINADILIEETLSNFFKKSIREEDNFATIWEGLLKHFSEKMETGLSKEKKAAWTKTSCSSSTSFAPS
jgi:hypothetical protein